MWKWLPWRIYRYNAIGRSYTPTNERYIVWRNVAGRACVCVCVCVWSGKRQRFTNAIVINTKSKENKYCLCKWLSYIALSTPTRPLIHLHQSTVYGILFHGRGEYFRSIRLWMKRRRRWFFGISFVQLTSITVYIEYTPSKSVHKSLRTAFCVRFAPYRCENGQNAVSFLPSHSHPNFHSPLCDDNRYSFFSSLPLYELLEYYVYKMLRVLVRLLRSKASIDRKIAFETCSDWCQSTKNTQYAHTHRIHHKYIKAYQCWGPNALLHNLRQH